MSTPAPATYCGILEGFDDVPSVELFNLTADIPGHCKESTVSRQTLESAGYFVPARNLNPQAQ
jgi:hypothetical protein